MGVLCSRGDRFSPVLVVWRRFPSVQLHLHLHLHLHLLHLLLHLLLLLLHLLLYLLLHLLQLQTEVECVEFRGRGQYCALRALLTGCPAHGPAAQCREGGRFVDGGPLVSKSKGLGPGLGVDSHYPTGVQGIC